MSWKVWIIENHTFTPIVCRVLDETFVCKSSSLTVQFSLEDQCCPLVVSYASFMSHNESVMKGTWDVSKYEYEYSFLDYNGGVNGLNHTPYLTLPLSLLELAPSSRVDNVVD